MRLSWLPCPGCGDDNTYQACCTIGKRCGNCYVIHSVGLTAGRFLVIRGRKGRNRNTFEGRRVPKPHRTKKRHTVSGSERMLNGRSVKWRSSRR